MNHNVSSSFSFFSGLIQVPVSTVSLLCLCELHGSTNQLHLEQVASVLQVERIYWFNHCNVYLEHDAINRDAISFSSSFSSSFKYPATCRRADIFILPPSSPALRIKSRTADEARTLHRQLSIRCCVGIRERMAEWSNSLCEIRRHVESDESGPSFLCLCALQCLRARGVCVYVSSQEFSV